jgi:hypothetical protein
VSASLQKKPTNLNRFPRFPRRAHTNQTVPNCEHGTSPVTRGVRCEGEGEQLVIWMAAVPQAIHGYCTTHAQRYGPLPRTEQPPKTTFPGERGTSAYMPQPEGCTCLPCFTLELRNPIFSPRRLEIFYHFSFGGCTIPVQANALNPRGTHDFAIPEE